MWEKYCNPISSRITERPHRRYALASFWCQKFLKIIFSNLSKLFLKIMLPLAYSSSIIPSSINILMWNSEIGIHFSIFHGKISGSKKFFVMYVRQGNCALTSTLEHTCTDVYETLVCQRRWWPRRRGGTGPAAQQQLLFSKLAGFGEVWPFPTQPK